MARGRRGDVDNTNPGAFAGGADDEFGFQGSVEERERLVAFLRPRRTVSEGSRYAAQGCRCS